MRLPNLFKKKADSLSTEISPGGKNVNNMPLIIGGAVLAAFAAVISVIAMQKANQPTVQQDTTEKKPHAATKFAADLVNPYASGQIAATTSESQKKTQPEADKQEGQKTEAAVPSNPPHSEPEQPFYIEEIDKIRGDRLRAFDAALRSRTVVPASGFSRQQSARADVQARITETRQQLASVGDPSTLYRERMAGLRLTDNASLPGSTSSDNDITQFDRKNRWSLPNTVETSESPYLIRAGFVIPAIMLSGINSDLPGQVMAQVSQNVYDTATGKYLLIPQGTRLVGTYNSSVAYGQERVLMAWQRLIFPDGSALDIQAMPGADSAGYAGFTDEINNHYWRTFSSAILLSGVIAGVSMSQNGNSDDRSDRQRASDALSESLGQTLGSTMAQLFSKNLNVSPTLQIRPGYRFNVMITKDITLPGVYETYRR